MLIKLIKKFFEYLYRKRLKLLKDQKQLVFDVYDKIKLLNNIDFYFSEESGLQLKKQIKKIYFIKLKKYKKYLNSEYIIKLEELGKIKKNLNYIIQNHHNKYNRLIKLKGQANIVESIEISIDDLNQYKYYLTKKNKKQIKFKLNELDLGEIKEYQKYLDKSYLSKLSKIRKFEKKIDSFLKSFNDIFIKEEKLKFKDYFDGLTESQKEAVIIEEENNLVVAGAGSGKTSVIISKIGYLIKKNIANANQILILTFSNDTENELKNRAEKNLSEILSSSELQIMTFHKLGLKLRSKANIKSKGISDLAINKDNVLSRWISGEIEDLIKNEKFREKIIKYFSNHTHAYNTLFEFKKKGTYLKYIKKTKSNLTLKTIQQRNRDVLTFKRDLVKSFEECEIANFLYINQIQYTYEKPYHIDLSTNKKRNYKPDFTLINDFGERIYLEHFGLDSNGKAPSWFREGYKELVEQKVAMLSHDEAKCIFTYSHQKKSGKLIPHLKKSLKKYNFTLKPLSPDKIIEILNHSREITRFSDLLKTFLNHFKSENSNFNILRQQALRTVNPIRSNAFIDIFEIIYKKYSDILKEKDEIDFNDMINETEQIISSNPKIVEYPYNQITHVLVDEFQDTSIARFKFLKSLKKINPNIKYFCVGDDWQSIYKFNGSNVKIMTDFKKNFGTSSVSFLNDTFRFSQSMVEISTKFITKNKSQINKKIISQNNLIDKPITIVREKTEDTHKNREIEKVLDEINEKDQNAEILIIGRYNFTDTSVIKKIIQEKKYKNKISFKTIHKSKGLESDYVIVLDVNEELYGFPSQITDDPLINLVIKDNEEYSYAEERRLFYVALTRAKKEVYLVYKEFQQSRFISELSKENSNLKYINKIDENTVLCPICESQLIIVSKRDNQNIKYYLCSHRVCDFIVTIPKCKTCNSDEKITTAISVNNKHEGEFICTKCFDINNLFKKRSD